MARRCSWVGLEPNCDKRLTAKEMSGHVPSMVYISDPTSCWYRVVRDESEVLSQFATNLVPGVKVVCVGRHVVMSKRLRMC